MFLFSLSCCSSLGHVGTRLLAFIHSLKQEAGKRPLINSREGAAPATVPSTLLYALPPYRHFRDKGTKVQENEATCPPPSQKGRTDIHIFGSTTARSESPLSSLEAQQPPSGHTSEGAGSSPSTLFFPNTYLFYLLIFFIFLAALGLSCSMQDLLLWRTGLSLVVAHGLPSAWAL